MVATGALELFYEYANEDERLLKKLPSSLVFHFSLSSFGAVSLRQRSNN
jgi:hypothetical protein